MHNHRFTAIVVAAVLAWSAAGCAAGQESAEAESKPSASGPATAAATERPEPQDLTIPAPSLADTLVGESTEQHIQVALPVDYATSGKNYPVVYYLPGFGDGYEVFTDVDPGQMILVGVNGLSKVGGSFYVNSPVTGNWEDFVTKDVISYVDATFRTVAEPSGRAIVGHSMGGFGVLNAAMHTDVFSYAYALSPGVFDKDGMDTFAMDFGVLTTFVESIADLDDAGARSAYLERISQSRWPTNLSFAYSAAFAPDPKGRAPYVELPEQDKAGEYKHDAVWRKYDAGYGDIPAKLEKYGSNLKALKGFVIEYGTNDEFEFIPKGCDYLSAQLTNRGIDHDLVTYEGKHQDKLTARITDVVLPYLAEKFAA